MQREHNSLPGLIILTFLILAFYGNSCIAQTRATVSINGNSLMPNKYLGNGVQWDPYQLDYGAVTLEIDDQDWKKLYDRLDFMRPQVIRVMINTTSSLNNGKLDPQKLEQSKTHSGLLSIQESLCNLWRLGWRNGR